jgi:hypothetical protein
VLTSNFAVVYVTCGQSRRGLRVAHIPSHLRAHRASIWMTQCGKPGVSSGLKYENLWDKEHAHMS